MRSERLQTEDFQDTTPFLDRPNRMVNRTQDKSSLRQFMYPFYSVHSCVMSSCVHFRVSIHVS